MTPEDFKRAEELLTDPDYEDCERFASWYGHTLLDAARNQADLIAALQEAIDLIVQITQSRWSEWEASEEETVGDFRAAIAKATTPTSGEAQ